MGTHYLGYRKRLRNKYRPLKQIRFLQKQIEREQLFILLRFMYLDISCICNQEGEHNKNYEWVKRYTLMLIRRPPVR